jgi:tRNA modification GTPase
MGEFMFNDTIVAPATGNANNAISIIRISGDDAIAICNSVFSVDLDGILDRTVVYGKIRDKNSDILDDCLAVKYVSPKSYTGEDVVEFFCHGGRVVSECVIRELIANGARVAEKGEFTKRAFLNGKLDLSQAEAIIDTINAQTKNALLMAQKNLDGKLREKVEKIRTEIIALIMEIMAGNDFPDEHQDSTNQDASVHTNAIIEKIDVLCIEVAKLVESYDTGKIIRDGITCAIWGSPNVGKSSLLNAILDEDRAIVTEIAGTTRDVITERIDIGGYILNIADTAGIRESDDIVEKAGIKKTHYYIQNVDFSINILDLTDPNLDDFEKMPQHFKDNTILVLNKIDVADESDDIKNLASKYKYCYRISAKEKIGIKELIDGIKSYIEEKVTIEDNENIIFSERHFNSLMDAYNGLFSAKNALENSFEPDIASIDLEVAASAMGEITGATVNDEVIDSIFKNFCIGK